MPDNDAPDPDDLRRTREAARIFRRLEEVPDDPDALAARDAFLNRGAAEQETYAQMSRALSAARTGMRRRSRKTATGLICALLAMLYIGYDPIRTRVLADHYTTDKVSTVQLDSGDMANLDASSALIDATDGAERRVTLMKGAAFFDVDQTGRRFIVQSQGLTVEAIGTAFEVADVGTAIQVTVSEGIVEVGAGSETWRLTAGDRLQWSDAGIARQDSVGLETIAAWRGGQFVMDGMSFAQAIAVIDRRLAGEIVITDSALASVRVSGGLDLTEPLQALRLLAASSDATVRAAPPLVTLVSP